jgi:phosphomevalonate kinase
MSSERTTLVGSPVVIAPGKLFLVGEYAVLDDGPAVVAAVSRYAVAQYLPGLDPMSPVVAEAVKRSLVLLGEAAAALPPGSVLVNTDDFRDGDAKLGLGSSAATAVATVGSVFESTGRSLSHSRDEIFAVALSAHQSAQGGKGSGADVAAATYGGVIKFQRTSGKLDVESLTLPAALHLVVFWTGQSASTPAMIDSVGDFAKRDPAGYRTSIDDLKATADRFLAAIRADNATGAIEATAVYGKQLEALGAAASVPIVTPDFVRAAEIARGLGGAAKPSGAGGGDIGVGLFAAAEAASRFAKALPRPLVALDLDIDLRGVRRRQPGDERTSNSGMFHV